MAITGGDPLNSTFRGRLTRFVRSVARAWSAPPPTPEQVVQAGMARMRRARADLVRREAGAPPPVVSGAGWPVLLDPVLRIDADQQAIFSSDDAKYGRVSTTYGIVPQAYADQGAATNLTLEKVAEFHHEADAQGLLYRKADMDFSINRKDPTIYAAQRARTSPVYRSRLQLAPADASPLAFALCAVVRRVIDGIPGFCTAEDNLLSAAAHGYAGLEPVYRRPAPFTVQVSRTKSVTVQDFCGVASLESVHPRDFRWAPVRRQMLLDTGGGRYVDPFVTPDGRPTNKLILHSTAGMGDPHQRGYDYAASPMHLLKFQGVARWSVMLELFGVSTPYAQYEGEGYADDGDVQSALRFLSLLGRGKPALLAQKFGDVKVTPTPTGVDGRGQHAAIIGVINAELLKLIQGQSLTSEVGGSASYALANVQADSLEAVQLLDAAQAADTMTHQLVIYILRENAEQLAAAFGVPPEQILAVAPRAYRTLDRRVDPKTRLDILTGAKRDLGMPVDLARVAEELGIPLVEGDQGDRAPTAPAEGDPQGPGVDLTATAQAAVITVDEARAAMGLGPLGGDEGGLSVAEFMARHKTAIADAATAEQGGAKAAPQETPGAAATA